jgi:hypothetical protein
MAFKIMGKDADAASVDNPIDNAITITATEPDDGAHIEQTQLFLPSLPSIPSRLMDRFSWKSTMSSSDGASIAPATNKRDSLVIHHKNLSRYSRNSSNSTSATIGTSKQKDGKDLERGGDDDGKNYDNNNRHTDVTSSAAKTYIFIAIILIIFLGIFTATVVLSIRTSKMDGVQSSNWIIPANAKPVVILVQNDEGRISDSVVKFALTNGTVLI